MEFTGEGISQLPIDDRFSMCNMAIEAGGKSGIIEVDDVTVHFLKETLREKFEGKEINIYRSDKDATYAKIIEYDISNIEPLVALPHLPSNVKPVGKVGDIKIDQAVIGSCTNGRISDLRTAAHILRGKKVHPDVRCIVFPATQAIMLQATKEGLIEAFIDAGAVVSTPTCGPCLGGHMGILAEGEKAIATTNRNFVGRMGHSKSEVYLSGAAVAAASAIAGKIIHPDEL
jgi:3-isopropylmalate/(R)-2-methylmalate dehydratase large subunit